MVFMFASRNVLTIVKMLLRVSDRNMYPFPPKKLTQKKKTKSQIKNKLHKL